MHDQLYENANNLYTTVLLPLTEKDKLVIEKTIKNHYQINVLLLPLLVLIYFWGLVYFLIFLAVVLAYNISAFYSINKHEVSLNNQKTVLTGKITRKEPPGEEMIFFFGPERFDVTYANITYPVEVGDTISLHYSQFSSKRRGILLSVEKENYPISYAMLVKP
ncbi:MULTISPECIES: hypothetical protein [Chryseobacterium]|uniref:hypothetical protein n=1 Tax=Chryseobacterium TaxID=59732 RepID=UPI001BE5818E|nr:MULTISPECIES: hypothetical protein [Chryseobacterium]MBT2619988.1 hypothetical protein [Chryseobacterium sp. ISL-6]